MGKIKTAAARGAGLLLTIAVGVLMPGCGGFQETVIQLAPGYCEWLTPEEMAERGHAAFVETLSDEYTAAYENADGTCTVYAFAAPVCMLPDGRTPTLIDTRLKNTGEEEPRDNGFVYQVADNSILSYYPRALSESRGVYLRYRIDMEFGPEGGSRTHPRYGQGINFIGRERDMLTYADAGGKGIDWRVYPSALGTNGEWIFHGMPPAETSFWVRLHDDGAVLRHNEGGYLTVEKEEREETEILGVIQRPILRTAAGACYLNNSLSVERNDAGSWRVTVSWERAGRQAGATAFFSFEMRRRKWEDNAVYSGLPTLQENYLSNVALIGNGREAGRGRLMIRYQISPLLHRYVDRIQSAVFYTRSLSGPDDKLELRPIRDDWCSVTGDWSRYYEAGEPVAFSPVSGGAAAFDITESVREWCENPEGMAEHRGLLLRSAAETWGTYQLLLTNDNSLYPVRTEIVLSPAV